MRGVIIAGAGMTEFGHFPGTGMRDLATRAAFEALKDAGIEASALGRIFFGNAAGATVGRQDMVRGQVAFRHTPLSRVPIINVENACASGGSSLMLAYEMVGSGAAEVVLAIGTEQLSHVERDRTFTALRGSMDINEIGETETSSAASVLMEGYAGEGRKLIEDHGVEVADFARVAVKNRIHAGMNPRAHYRKPQSLEEVLSAREIAAPLTLSMCSPITDGSAALVICSEEYAAKHDLMGPRILSSQIAPGNGVGSAPLADAVTAAYEMAGVGPLDMDLIELHDAAAPAELLQYADVGICAVGEGYHLIRNGDTSLGGRIPVNVSGGLLSRGHPLGATGCAQVFELYEHLTGRAGKRQVEGAKIGLAANAGGWISNNYAVGVATILSMAHQK